MIPNQPSGPAEPSSPGEPCSPDRVGELAEAADSGRADDSVQTVQVQLGEATSTGDATLAKSLDSSDTPEDLLRTDSLTLRYGKHLAVDGLNLCIREGEIYGVLGRNGAGKTSTLRMIMGICKPDSGSVIFAGKTMRRIGNAQKRQIGYVSQEQFFYPWMTCARLGRFVGGLYPTWDDGEFQRLLNAFDLPKKRRVSHLSGGMKVKLALALALSHRPLVLILDEPTAGLDPVARREFLDLIRLQAQRDRRTTVFSSHLIDEVERVADRVGIIHRGKLCFEGSLDELRHCVRILRTQPDDATIQERLDRAGLKFLHSDPIEPACRWFHGTDEAWSRAQAEDLHPEPTTLEDAFIAMTAEPASV